MGQARCMALVVLQSSHDLALCEAHVGVADLKRVGWSVSHRV